MTNDVSQGLLNVTSLNQACEYSFTTDRNRAKCIHVWRSTIMIEGAYLREETLYSDRERELSTE